MVSFLKTRLGAMMFLQYVIWGAWYVTLNTYLTSTLKFSGTEAGAVFGTTALASLVAPFLVGSIADRFFATERVLATLYALGAVFLLLATQVTSFGAVYLVLLAFCLCYFPTIALTNSITMQQVADPGREFPPHPHAGDHRLDCHRLCRRLPAGGSRHDAVRAWSGGKRRDVRLQPGGAPAHAAARVGAEGDSAERARARRAGDAEGSDVSRVRDRVGAGVHSADLLLLVHQRVSQRSRRESTRPGR